MSNLDLKETISNELKMLKNHITADNRKHIAKIVGCTTTSLYHYFDGKVSNPDKGIKILKECRKIIEARKKELEEITR